MIRRVLLVLLVLVLSFLVFVSFSVYWYKKIGRQNYIFYRVGDYSIYLFTRYIDKNYSLIDPYPGVIYVKEQKIRGYDYYVYSEYATVVSYFPSVKGGKQKFKVRFRSGSEFEIDLVRAEVFLSKRDFVAESRVGEVLSQVKSGSVVNLAWQRRNLDGGVKKGNKVVVEEIERISYPDGMLILKI